MRKNQRIVVTGASGFIGSALRTELAKRKRRVVVTSLRLSDRNGFFKILRPGDIVVHLACSTIPTTSEQNPQKDVQDNVIGTLNLLAACRHKKVAKFIFASSGGTVYGDRGQHRARESDPTEPQNAHGAMKLAIEKYIGVYGSRGLASAILRISNPYGRKAVDAKTQGAVDIFLKKGLAGEAIEIWGDGKIVRDYVHIDDVIAFFVRAIEHKNVRGVYNVGTGMGTSLNMLLKLIARATKKKLRVRYRPSRGLDVAYNVLDIRKARAAGWRPRYTLLRGIRESYRKNYQTAK